MSFQDLFSHDSAAYRDARPTYPEALFAWIATASRQRCAAWDCACGNGQATVPLSRYFDKVYGTDASKSQIEAAPLADNIEFRVADAGASGLTESSVDVVTCAQAAHWFDHDAFHREVRRVLKPGGLLCLWTYGVHHVSDEFDLPMGEFYSEVVGPYWPPERHHVDSHYTDLPFPFDRIEAPSLEMEHEWDLAQLFAYVSTWSASKAYTDANGVDPIQTVRERLTSAWGDPATRRTVRWPLTILAAYVGESSGS